MMVGFGVAIGLFIGFAQGRAGAADVGRTVAVSILYSVLIGVPAWLGIDVVAERLRRRSAPLRIAVIAAVLLLATAAALVIANLALVAVGWLPRAAFARNLGYSARVSLVIGALFTVGATVYERLRRRLADARRSELEARALAAQAQLAALESRVHPHFLFNALNSVLALIADDPARAERLLEKLSALLRSALDAERRGEIELAEELAIVRDYLDIEATRLGDRLRWAIDDAELPEGARVPAFAVQTLVENSVRHGIAPRRRGGRVEVAVSGDGRETRVEVWDDGPGFERDAVRPGRGIDNVEARLASYHGGAARLELGRERGGMSVAMVVPCN